MNLPTVPHPFLDEAKALACVHCGLCLSACPTYLETGNENLSPRGRIYLMRALQSGRLPATAEAVRPLDSCLGCRACESACPSGVAYGVLLEETRGHVETRVKRSLWQSFLRRVMIARIFPHPERFRLAMLPVQLLRRFPFPQWLPALVREWLDLLPPLPPPATWPARIPPVAGVPQRGRVGLVLGCVMRVLFPETHAATIRLLARAGYEVVIPEPQGCCGALHAHNGQTRLAQELARANVRAFADHSVDWIAVNAAGCGSTLKEYSALLADDPAWAGRAEQFSRRVRDLSEILAELPAGRFRFADAGAGRVACHDACHLAHAQRITDEPRRLVKAVAGDRYVELPEADVCCGSAGSYNLTEPDMARRLQQRKIEHVIRAGVTTLVTTNPGCIMQIRAGLRAGGAAQVEVMHLAEFLDAWRFEGDGAAPASGSGHA